MTSVYDLLPRALRERVDPADRPAFAAPESPSAPETDDGDDGDDAEVDNLFGSDDEESAEGEAPMEQEVLEVQDLDYNPATNRFFTRRSMEDEVVSGPSMSPLETAENGTTLKTSVPYVGGSFVRGAYEIFKRALKDEPKKIVAFVQKFARTKVLSEEKILKVAQTYLKEKGLQAPPIDVLQSSTDIVEPPGGFSPLTGLPQFGNVLPFVATTAAGKSKNPLILEKDAEESHSVLLRRFPVGADAAESAIFDAGVDLGANFAPVISVVGAPKHPKLLEAIRNALGRALPADQAFKVLVRFDVGSAAGMSGFDTFAPHLVFDIRANKTGDKRKGGGSGRAGGKPSKEPKPAQKPGASAPKNRKEPPPGGSTDALNGTLGSFNRPWQRFAVEDTQAGAGQRESFCMGAKLNLCVPRVAELIVERARPEYESRVYLSSLQSVENVEFGDALVPENAPDGWLGALMGRVGSGFMPLQDKTAQVKPVPWHTMAYVTVVAEDVFDAGMDELKLVAAGLEPETQRARMLRDAFEPPSRLAVHRVVPSGSCSLTRPRHSDRPTRRSRTTTCCRACVPGARLRTRSTRLRLENPSGATPSLGCASSSKSVGGYLPSIHRRGPKCPVRLQNASSTSPNASRSTSTSSALDVRLPTSRSARSAKYTV